MMDDDVETQDWYSEETATFGDRLAAAREASGLGQKELAQRVGVKNSTMRAWEDDLSEPRANRLSHLAGILNVSLSWMLTGKGDGLQAPSDQDDPSAPDLTGLLTDLRGIRAQIAKSNDQLAQLEKRLKRMGSA